MGTTEIKEFTRSDIDKFLKLKIVDNEYVNKPFAYNELEDYILTGKVYLEVFDDDGTNVIDENCVELIKHTMPFLLKIFDSPRSFITSVEEKVPIETAKRINYKAISHLSRDSNDWHDRTILSVKPKNILSDVNEETLDLYENRFVCSLVKRISKLLIDARHYYEEAINEYETLSASSVIDGLYHTNSLVLYKKISNHSNMYLNKDSFKEKMTKELEKIKLIESKLRSIKRSEIYKSLSRKKKVIDPINKTNILMFDRNYNEAYKLWNDLNANLFTEKLDNSVQESKEDLNKYYHIYNILCFLASLSDLSLVETTNNKIVIENNGSVHPVELCFKIDEYSLRVNITCNDIKCSIIKKDESKHKTTDNVLDEFNFYSNYLDFQGMLSSIIDNETEKILNTNVITGKFTKTTGNYTFINVDLKGCSEQNTISEKLCRRFFGMGDNFSREEKDENLIKWNNYKACLINCSPLTLRKNFLKIEKIINYHLIKTKQIDNTLTICPICGSDHFHSKGFENYVCNGCGHNVSITYCNKCDSNHNSPILWIKYMDDSFLEYDIIKEKLEKDEEEYTKMEYAENLMGEHATTSFKFVKDRDGWKIKTICPRCGIVLGD